MAETAHRVEERERPNAAAPLRTSSWGTLAAICAAALALRVGAAVALPNVVWPDEIFQTLEQAHRLVFGYGVIPWEFRDGARSWLLPGALAGAMAAVRWAGDLAHVRAAQVLLSVASLAPICAAFLWARARGRAVAVAAAVACASWFELVLFAPKALGEVVAAHVLVVALYLGSRARELPRAGAWAGAALALALALRIQLAPAVLVAAAFAAGRDPRRWTRLALGAAPVVVAAGLVDLATWGAPFRSYVETFRVNVLEGRSALYGVRPWWAYGEMLWSAWGWTLPPLAALAALGARRRLDLAATAVAVVIAHALVAHKEYRFVYPTVLLLVVLAAVGTAEAAARIAARWTLRPAAVAAVAALAWLAASWSRADGNPAWRRGRGPLEATRLAGERGTCGLALVGQHWAATGGYTWLHRDVPVYLVEDGQQLAAAWPGFDAALVSPEYVAVMRGFGAERCWEDVCLVRRPGGCAAVSAPTVNARLSARGE